MFNVRLEITVYLAHGQNIILVYYSTYKTRFSTCYESSVLHVVISV